MFNRNNEERCKELESKLNDAYSQLQDIARSRKDVYIIKLYPENPDQFELNGEFIVDDSKAVYGSHNLTFSESVLFKAGKEVATKQFEEDKSKLVSELDLKKNEIKQLEARSIEAETLYNETLKKSFDQQSNFNKTCNAYKEEIEELNNKLQTQKDEYEYKLCDCKERIDRLNELVKYWKDKYMRVDPIKNASQDVETKFGVVKAQEGTLQ